MNIKKRILIGIVISLFSPFGFSQLSDTLEAGILLRQAQILTDSAQWDSATKTYLNAIVLWEKVIADPGQKVGLKPYYLSMNGLANSWCQQREYVKADSLWNEYFLKMETELSSESPIVADGLFIKALILFANQQKEKSLNMLKEVLRIRQTYLKETDVKIAEVFERMGFCYSDSQQRLSYYMKALPVYQSQDHIRLANVLYAIGDRFKEQQNFEKAIEYYLQAIPVIKSRKLPFLASCLNQIAMIHANMENHEMALTYFLPCLESKKSQPTKNPGSLAGTMVNISIQYRLLGNYSEALNYSFEALPILEAEKHRFLANCLINIGTIYEESGDFEKGLEYFQQARDGSKDPYAKSVALRSIGTIYISMGEHEKALEIFQETLAYNQSIFGDEHPLVADVLGSIGRIYYNQEKTELALEFFGKGLAMKKKFFPPDHSDLGTFLISIGNVHAKAKHYEKAIGYYHQALPIYQKARLQNRLLCLNNLGELYRKVGKYEESLKYLQESLILNIEGFRTTNPEINPRFDALVANSFEYLMTMQYKAQTFYAMRDKADFYEKEADSCAQFAVNLIDRIRMGYQGDHSKLRLQEKSRSIYRLAFQISLALFEKTGKEEYLNHAFAVTEKSKAVILSEFLKSQRALQFASIPLRIIQQENELRSEIDNLEGIIFNLEENPDSARLVEIRSKLFSTKQSYDSLLSSLENTYTDYYDLKYRSDFANPIAIQKKIPTGSVFLTYFLGDTMLYSFAITKEEVHFHKQNISPDFEAQILAFHQKNSSEADYALGDFLDKSHALYRVLIRPHIEIISKKKLIISPAGILAIIPFETLVKSKSKSKSKSEGKVRNLSSLSFLVKEHEISYVYSGTIFVNSSRPKSTNQKVIAFAPSFDDYDPQVSSQSRKVRGNLAKLYGTVRELETLEQFFQVKTFTEEEANESKFKALSSEYGILHFATHAIIEPDDPMKSYLVFTANNDSLEDNNLYAWELYNMRLNAQMAVLSACNTGFGKLQRGEGIMSLGRAFAYAGVPSIVMSLWPAEDESTADLMGYFYEGLAEGQNKDEALRNAKLRYLAESPPSKHHPFYWAGFVVQGDAGPLGKKSSLPIVIILMSIVILILGLLGIRRYRKRDLKN